MAGEHFVEVGLDRELLVVAAGQVVAHFDRAPVEAEVELGLEDEAGWG